MLRARPILSALFVSPIILSACAKSPTAPTDQVSDEPPPQLTMDVTTDDAADLIRLFSDHNYNGSRVQVCLIVRTESGWWKGVGINQTEPTLEGTRDDGAICTTVAPGNLSLTFWKAKAFGVHTQVGSAAVDLSAYAGYSVAINWLTD